MNWHFRGNILVDEAIPEKAIAFLYMITHVNSGKWYIGRKNLFRTVTKNIKTTKIVKGIKTVKVKKQKSSVYSDWKEYWSSSEYLKDFVLKEGKDQFKREILLFVETNAATIYSEEALLYITGSMFNPLCINGHIRTKIMRKWFENKEVDLHKRIEESLLFHKFKL